MPSIQLWTAQVCGCTVHELIADSGSKTYATEAEAEAVRQFRRLVNPDLTSARGVPVAKLCKTHTLLGHVSSMYDALLADNLMLKRLVSEFIPNRVAGFEDDRLSWDLTVTGVLNISIRNITGVARTRLQADANVAFGVGKVVVL